MIAKRIGGEWNFARKNWNISFLVFLEFCFFVVVGGSGGVGGGGIIVRTRVLHKFAYAYANILYNKK